MEVVITFLGYWCTLRCGERELSLPCQFNRNGKEGHEGNTSEWPGLLPNRTTLALELRKPLIGKNALYLKPQHQDIRLCLTLNFSPIFDDKLTVGRFTGP
jgi:hypothetical protein